MVPDPARAPNTAYECVSGFPVDRCTDEDMLSADVYSASGRKLASANTTLNEYLRSHLILNNVRRVSIYRGEHSFPDSPSAGKRLAGVYRESVIRVKELFIDLSAGRPLNIDQVRKISDTILRQKDTVRNFCILRLMNKIEAADQYTYSHSINVAFYAMFIAKWLGLPTLGIERSLLSGLLHDLGKTQIPDEILNKRGPLTKKEYERMKTHVDAGYQLMRGIPEIEPCVKEAVLLHHERLDGSGYPLGIVPDNLFARIVAVADVYDAVTSDRCYKKGTTPFAAFELFHSDGKLLFDWHIVSTFCSNVSAALTGAEVGLASGETGRIVYIPPDNPARPIVFTNSCYVAIPVEEKRRAICRISI